MVKGLIDEKNVLEQKVETKWSLGIGATADCNLNCEHCYSKPLRGQSLSLDEFLGIIDGKEVSSINFGTGENILHKDFLKMVDSCYDRGIKISVTSNGYSIMKMSDEYLKKFNDVDISLDFTNEEEQNAFRHGTSWSFVDKAIEKCQRLGVEFSLTTALMNVNYKEIPSLLKKAGEVGSNLRLNVFKPVPDAGIYKFQLSYDQFWESMGLLFEHGECISCSEPIVNAMLGIKPIVPQSPCGRNSLRIHPDGKVVPCVYWTDADVQITDLKDNYKAVKESANFDKIKAIPSYCLENCDKVDVCGGGCASRRYLNPEIGLENPDMYCPIYLGKEIPKIPVTFAEEAKDLVHASYLCTLIFQAKK